MSLPLVLLVCGGLSGAETSHMVYSRLCSPLQPGFSWVQVLRYPVTVTGWWT